MRVYCIQRMHVLYYIFILYYEYYNIIYGRKIRDKCIGIMIVSGERGQKSYR